MKRILICAALCFAVCNVSARLIASANDEALTVKSFSQHNKAENTYAINPSIKDGELAYTAVSLTRTSSIAGKQYDYILWTEGTVSGSQAQQLVSYIASKASGDLAGITPASTLLVSGAGHTWYAGGGKADYMTFARQSFYQSDKNLSSKVAAGAYTVTGDLETSPTTAQQSTQTTSAAQTTQVTQAVQSTTQPANISAIPECGS